MTRFVLLLILSLLPFRAYAESYLGLQIDEVFPQKTGTVNLQSSTVPAGTTTDPVSLQNSLMYGMKAGHFFTKGLDYFGVETEVYNATPHLKQQDTTVRLPAGFVFVAPPSCAGSSSCTVNTAGALLRVTTWAPIIVLYRYPGARVQPYGGVGLGVFFAHSNVLGPSASDITPGLVAKAGVSYKLTDHFGSFLEYKYNQASFAFESGGAKLSITLHTWWPLGLAISSGNNRRPREPLIGQ